MAERSYRDPSPGHNDNHDKGNFTCVNSSVLRRAGRKLPPRAPKLDPKTERVQNAHKSQFASTGQLLYKLYEHDQFTDVMVQCGQYVFSAHAVVLACHSDYFSRVLHENKTYVDNHRHVTLPPRVSATAFHILLDYMYEGILHIDSTNLAELLEAAVVLKMEKIEERCCEAFDAIKPENMLEIWEIAVREKLLVVAETTIKVIGENFQAVSKSKAFLNLSSDALILLLSHDDLPVTSEHDVASAAIKWLHYQKDERRKYIANVMACVRLPLLNSQELFSIIKGAEFIFNDKDVQNMFLVANWFATSRDLDVPCKLEHTLPGRRDTLHKKERGQRRVVKKVTHAHAPSYLDDTDVEDDFTKEKEASFYYSESESTFPSEKANLDYRHSPDEYEEEGEIPMTRGILKDTLFSKQALSYASKDRPRVKLGSLSSLSSKAPLPPLLGHLMLLGGHELDNNANVTLSYNRGADSWMSHVDLPAARTHHVTIILRGIIYIIGGNDPSVCREDGALVPRNTTFAFIVAEERWQQMAPMKVARTRHGACVLNDKIFVVGGCNEKGVLYSVECYNKDIDNWEFVTSMASSRLGAGVTAYCEQIVVTGGYGMVRNGTRAILRSVESFDFETGTWSHRAPLRIPRCHGCLLEAENALYLCGGLQPISDSVDFRTASMSAIDVYYDVTDTWAVIADLKVPRHQAAAAAFDGKIYIVGGMSTQTGKASNAMECYDIATSTWDENVKNLPCPLVGCGLVPVTFQ